MSERIIVALIGVLGTFAGSFFTNRKSMALIIRKLLWKRSAPISTPPHKR